MSARDVHRRALLAAAALPLVACAEWERWGVYPRPIPVDDAGENLVRRVRWEMRCDDLKATLVARGVISFDGCGARGTYVEGRDGWRLDGTIERPAVVATPGASR